MSSAFRNIMFQLYNRRTAIKLYLEGSIWPIVLYLSVLLYSCSFIFKVLTICASIVIIKRSICVYENCQRAYKSALSSMFLFLGYFAINLFINLDISILCVSLVISQIYNVNLLHNFILVSEYIAHLNTFNNKDQVPEHYRKLDSM